MITQTASTGRELQRIGELEAEVSHLRKILDTKRSLAEVFNRFGMKQEYRFVQEKMAGCSESNNVWLAVMALLRQTIFTEHLAARSHNLSNEEVRYNLGRETALEDFQTNLLDVWAQANKPVK